MKTVTVVLRLDDGEFCGVFDEEPPEVAEGYTRQFMKKHEILKGDEITAEAARNIVLNTYSFEEHPLQDPKVL